MWLDGQGVSDYVIDNMLDELLDIHDSIKQEYQHIGLANTSESTRFIECIIDSIRVNMVMPDKDDDQPQMSSNVQDSIEDDLGCLD
jgi:hypothetical protein